MTLNYFPCRRSQNFLYRNQFESIFAREKSPRKFLRENCRRWSIDRDKSVRFFFYFTLKTLKKTTHNDGMQQVCSNCEKKVKWENNNAYECFESVRRRKKWEELFSLLCAVSKWMNANGWRKGKKDSAAKNNNNFRYLTFWFAHTFKAKAILLVGENY